MDTNAPRIDAEITLQDGRHLAYAIWGDPEGQPAVLCHGAPASRMFTPDPALTAKIGLRLITIDRPGYGRSTAKTGRTILDWVGDLSELVGLLDLHSFSMVAHSAGGPYALACATQLPQIRRISLVSSVAPLDHDPELAFSDEPSERELVYLARHDPDRAQAMIADAAGWLAEEPDRFLALPGPRPRCAAAAPAGHQEHVRVHASGGGPAGTGRLCQRRSALPPPLGLRGGQASV